MRRAALIVGVNRYEDPGIAKLEYAENDAIEVWSFLKHQAGYEDARMLLAADDDCILDTAAELVRELEPGDLFLFYFAGHGVAHAGRHLLLCPRVKGRRLLDDQAQLSTNHTVPVDLLRQETARPGLARMFVLDACRSNLLRGREGAVEGLKGEQGLRDIVGGPTGLRDGSLAIVCSCAEGRQAQEVPAAQHGLFSQAWLEEMAAARQAGREVRLNDTLMEGLRGRMIRLASAHGLPREQHPWLVRSGELPVVVAGQLAAAPAGPAPANSNSPRASRVLCLACGLRNDPDDTFKCVRCGRDYLCREHYVKASRCCEECEEKRAEEERSRQETERKRLEEDQRQAALRAEAERQRVEEERRRKDPAYASKDRPWENSLGMQFVPVPNTQVLFCIWEVRVQDYAAYARANPGINGEWQKPGFAQGPTHPVVNVSWEDGQAFCQWLTSKEQKEGRIKPPQRYRLPTDEEWSWAVGLPREAGAKPKEKDEKIKNHYPWGNQWPPPKGAGNYDQSLQVDEFEYTSPVGSFAPNPHGLYDLGGNVWEWCEDWYDNDKEDRVLRGASWYDYGPGALLSAYRLQGPPDYRGDYVGVRVVLGGAAS